MGERRDPHRFDDLFVEFGPISLCRFFGREGIRSGDVMFGMIFGESIYFKTNEATREAFLAECCEPLTFEKGGRTIVTGWYALPDRLYDDPGEVAHYAKKALVAVSESGTVVQKRQRGRRTTARQFAHRRPAD